MGALTRDGAGARLLLDVQATLGEGPLWSERDSRLYFVDIRAATLHALSLDSGALDSWTLPTQIGWAIERAAGGLVVGLQDSIALLQLDPWRLQRLVDPHPHDPAMRLNDAKAGPGGQIFAGSMNDSDTDRSDGCLYRLDADGVLHTVDRGYRICNGPAISLDQRTLYHSDTARRVIYAYPLAADGTLGPRRVWKRFSKPEGFPDGMTVDAEGALWVAHWGAGCISRFADDGRLLRRVALPVSQPTSLTFAGPRLDRLIVTSARDGLSAEQLAREPLAGGLFELDNEGVRGMPAWQYGG
ncbi:sugar lactone lactonase YvrE [Paludibacterium purpuratum]|uniref:Regucalcin n=2 Tax=Paludibacterium purpuratum TaxID=1144873 RepID=A0A4R7B5U5_9NEIS|nr:sugar lactone lactonase YvrE [Paludibacterium purpuratum]